ncbi:MAG: hypothetical protein K0R71_2084 [Bacillales bacterium]|jgi:uncharacterized protein YqiB (DUF1249 family)|nr:hypothetical protein [Bacillales bacterium]
MKKILVSLFALTFILSGLTISSTVNAEMKKAPTPAPTQQIQLTTEQKAELAELYKEKQAVELKILDKYVEFKILTEEQKNRILEHKAKWLKNLEENGFAKPHQDHEKWKQSKPKF